MVSLVHELHVLAARQPLTEDDHLRMMALEAYLESAPRLEVRRRWVRSRLWCRARIVDHGAEAEVTDGSAGGFRIRTGAALVAGERVSIQLEEQARRYVFVCRVVWADAARGECGLALDAPER